MCQGMGGCGCCGVTSAKPPVSNPPGLSAISYRSGTHGTVLRRMLATLSSRFRALDETANDDPAVALLDAWAMVADVVTFYQERIANEGFLRTATERRSVLELARQIGYELRPGVASSTYLDFRIQVAAATAPVPGPTAPTSALVDAGTQVLSTPAQGKLPQTFETSQGITVAAALNELSLRTRGPQPVTAGLARLYLDGTTTGLRVGDPILIVQHADPPAVPAVWELRMLDTVTSVPATAADASPATRVTWTVGLPAAVHQPEVYAFDIRGAVFGHNAPDWLTLPDDVRQRYVTEYNDHHPDAAQVSPTDPQWPGFALPDANQPQAGGALDLAGAHPEVRAESYLVLTQPNISMLYRVASGMPSAREGFAINTKTTYLTLDRREGMSVCDRRQVTVLAASRQLGLADQPIADDPAQRGVTGPELELTAPAPLTVGQPVLITGTAAGAVVVHPATVNGVNGARVTLAERLPRPLDLESVRISGNVAIATNGETVPDEVLGSGDGTVANQRFTLHKPKLTHVTARTPSGVADSLRVWVDGVLWTQVPSLYQAGPYDRVYVVRIDNDARATVIFGDGAHGARLPTGQENVHATYRSGIGPDGDVEPHSLSLLPQRPLGVASVDNPAGASGGTAPEALAEARNNAPLTVLTLDRVVSLSDYEDFARSFGGIAKAGAMALPGGSAPTVFITVAGAQGTDVPREPTLDDLLGALDAVRDRGTAVRADSFVPLWFRLGVQVLAGPDRRSTSTDVHAAVREMLISGWSAARRSFGQPVTASEILAAVQAVEGVTASRLTELRFAQPVPRPGDPAVVDVLTAPPAQRQPTRVDPEHVRPAALLMLDPALLVIGEWTP